MKGYVYLLTNEHHAYIGSHSCSHTDKGKALFDGYTGSGVVQKHIQNWTKTILGFFDDCRLIEEMLISSINCQDSYYFLNMVNYSSYDGKHPITDYEVEQVETIITEIENVINHR